MMGQGGPANSVHLAWMPLASGETPLKEKIQYYCGGFNKRWSETEAEAVTLFSTVGYTSLSLSWLPGPERWMLLYSLASPGRPSGPGTAIDPRDPTQYNPNGPVVARFAETPWLWSAELIIFDPLRDNALGRFMHRPGDNLDKLPGTLPPDPARLAYDGVPGYAYGPFNLCRYTHWNANSRVLTLYYLMSTFAPTRYS